MRESRTERSRTPPPSNLPDRILFVEPKSDGIEMVLDVQPRDVHLHRFVATPRMMLGKNLG